METRREFLNAAALTAFSAAVAPLAAGPPARDEISLAAWSLVRSFRGGKWKTLDLPRICREQLGIGAVEFVNTLMENPLMPYLNQLKRAGQQHNVAFVRIMVDGEGDMAAVDRNDRMEAARAHRKWVDVAHYLGCKDIRCNMRGGAADWKTDKDLVKRAAESFNNLLEYAAVANIEVVIENHGGASSNPDILVAVMKAVNNPRFGTLPDFGNINPGDDRVEVVRKLMPYAKGVSVKAAWQPDGTNLIGGLEQIIKAAQDSGFHGYWGIESSYGRERRERPQQPAGGAQAGRPRAQQGARPGAGAPQQAEGSPDELFQNELKGVQLTKAVLERTVFKKS